LGISSNLTTTTTLHRTLYRTPTQMGSMVAGRLADRLGRRSAMLLCTYTFLLGGAVLAASPNMLALCVGRVMLGFASGFSSVRHPPSTIRHPPSTHDNHALSLLSTIQPPLATRATNYQHTNHAPPPHRAPTHPPTHPLIYSPIDHGRCWCPSI
jgi:MFS family permease